MAEENKTVDILIDLLTTIVLVGFFLIDVYSLWEYKFLGYGISSMIMAGITVVFLILVLIQYKDSFGVFELLLGGLIIGMGIGAHSYGAHQWFLNLSVYQAFFALGLAVIILNRPLKEWVFLIPLLVAGAYVIVYYFRYGRVSMTHAISMMQMNRNVFGKIVVTFGLLGSLHYYLHSVQRSFYFIFFPFITLLLSYASKSRSAIIVAVMYVGMTIVAFFVAIIKATKNSTKRRDYLRLAISLVIGIALIFFVVRYTLEHTRFATVGLDGSGRAGIVSGFLEAYTWKSFFVGVPPSTLGVFSNYHNSYLMVLGQSGFLGWVMLALCGWTFWVFLSLKKYVPCVFLLMLAVYSLVEYFIFLYVGDFILFPLIVYAHHEFQEQKKAKQILSK